jgi:membrane-associated PAP2 superfamily phosphatase
VAGLFYGALMGLTRMIQGGHFLTDVIWAGCLVYLTGLFLYYLFGLDREERPLHAAGNEEPLRDQPADERNR